MVHSIEGYCSGLLSNHNGFMRFLFSLLSKFMFAHCLLHCLLIVNVRSETKYSSPRKQWILMTCIYNILTLTPKGLTPDYAAGNQHRAFSRYLSITAPLSLLISLKAHGNHPKQCKL